MTPILAVRDLEKTFGNVVAARNISLEVPPQQTVGIIGANGAGKTTFVNMITGHFRPSKGSITFEQRDIIGLPSRAHGPNRGGACRGPSPPLSRADRLGFSAAP